MGMDAKIAYGRIRRGEFKFDDVNALAIQEVIRRQEKLAEVLQAILTDEAPPEGDVAFRAMLRLKLDGVLA